MFMHGRPSAAGGGGPFPPTLPARPVREQNACSAPRAMACGAASKNEETGAGGARMPNNLLIDGASMLGQPRMLRTVDTGGKASITNTASALALLAFASTRPARRCTVPARGGSGCGGCQHQSAHDKGEPFVGFSWVAGGGCQHQPRHDEGEPFANSS
eukprot:gene5111-biopygen4122